MTHKPGTVELTPLVVYKGIKYGAQRFINPDEGLRPCFASACGANVRGYRTQENGTQCQIERTAK